MGRLLHPVLLSLSLLCIVRSQVVEQPIGEETGYEFPNYECDLGDTVIFECDHYSVPNNSMPMLWMLPDLATVDLGFNDSNRIVANDGMSFTILSATKQDLGLYHCMLMTEENQWWLLKIGLNTRGPYYQDLWEKYQLPTAYAFGAMLSFLAAVGYIFVISYFSYDRRKERNQISSFEVREDDNIQNGTAGNYYSSNPGLEDGEKKEYEEIKGEDNYENLNHTGRESVTSL